MSVATHFPDAQNRSLPRGAVLLEVILALAILAGTGAAMLSSIQQARRTIQHVQRADRTLVAATRLLDAASLWTAEELDRRLGQHPQGRWTLDIQRESQTVYRLTLLGEPDGTPQLETYVARPTMDR